MEGVSSTKRGQALLMVAETPEPRSPQNEIASLQAVVRGLQTEKASQAAINAELQKKLAESAAELRAIKVKLSMCEEFKIAVDSKFKEIIKQHNREKDALRDQLTNEKEIEIKQEREQLQTMHAVDDASKQSELKTFNLLLKGETERHASEVRALTKKIDNLSLDCDFLNNALKEKEKSLLECKALVSDSQLTESKTIEELDFFTKENVVLKQNWSTVQASVSALRQAILTD